MVHLQDYGKISMCGKQPHPSLLVDVKHIHLVTCCACLRGAIERLENDVGDAWQQIAGESS